MLKKLMFIKDASFEELPSLHALLTAALEITRMDPEMLLSTLSKNMFAPDVLLKTVIFAESLEKREFEAFGVLVRTAIRTGQSNAQIQEMPAFFIQCKKDEDFLLGGFNDLSNLKKEHTKDQNWDDQIITFQKDNPQFYKTEELRQFMEFVSNSLSKKVNKR